MNMNMIGSKLIEENPIKDTLISDKKINQEKPMADKDKFKDSLQEKIKSKEISSKEDRPDEVGKETESNEKEGLIYFHMMNFNVPNEVEEVKTDVNIDSVSLDLLVTDEEVSLEPMISLEDEREDLGDLIPKEIKQEVESVDLSLEELEENLVVDQKLGERTLDIAKENLNEIKEEPNPLPGSKQDDKLEVKTNDLDEEVKVLDSKLELKVKPRENSKPDEETLDFASGSDGETQVLTPTSSKINNDFESLIGKNEEVINYKGENIEVNEDDFMDHILKELNGKVSLEKNEVKMTLKPDHLGELNMNLEVQKDGLVAKIMVDNYRSKELIENNISILKNNLENLGQEIKTVEVFVGHNSDFNMNQSSNFNLQENLKKMKLKKNNKRNSYEDNIGIETSDIIKKNESIGLEDGMNLLA